MAFSGTISQTTFNTRKVIDRAMGRCKITPQQITAEHIDIAKDVLYLQLSALANQGVPLWCIEKQIYPLYEGVPDISCPVGTVDLLNVNLRSLSEQTGTNTDTSTTRTVNFGTDIGITTVGILWSAASVNISIQRSADNTTWTVIQTETPAATAGQWTWYDLDSTVTTQYFRIVGTGTFPFTQIYLGNNPSEIPVSRLNRDDYTNLPNKSFQSSRPLQYWFDRQINQPVMHFWPVPNEAAATSQIIVWRHRHIMDVGTLQQEIEVPQRWFDAIIAGLAAKLAVEIAEVDAGLIPMLDQKAAAALYEAQAEERDNSPMMIAPNISAYTQ